MNIRWKPRSHNDRKLVVLLNGGRNVAVVDASGKVISSGRNFGASNGYQGTFRFDRAGREFQEGSMLKVDNKYFSIPNPGLNYGGKYPRNLSPADFRTPSGATSAAATPDITEASEAQAPAVGSNAVSNIGSIYSAVKNGQSPGFLSSGLANNGFVNTSHAAQFGLRGANLGAPMTPFESSMFGTGGGTGAVVNAAAPAFLAALAGSTLVRGLTGASAEDRFPSMFNQYISGNPSSLKDSPMHTNPVNQARTQYRSNIPSANRLFENAAAEAKSAGRSSVVDVGSAIAPKETVDNQIFSKAGKQYVMLSGSNPLNPSTQGGIDGRTAVSLNRYARIKNAYDNKARTAIEANRGGK